MASEACFPASFLAMMFMSRWPSPRCLARVRKNSRTRRFMRLRTTAPPVFLDAVTPMRGPEKLFGEKSAKKYVECTFFPFLERRRKAFRFRKRSVFLNCEDFDCKAGSDDGSICIFFSSPARRMLRNRSDFRICPRVPQGRKADDPWSPSLLSVLPLPGLHESVSSKLVTIPKKIQEPDQTLSLLRPLALLALRTRRPPTVDILFRKPWVLALLIRLG